MRHRTEAPLLILGVGSLPLLLLELARDRLAPGDRIFLDVVNVVVLVAFGADYVIGLILARPKWPYIKGEWLNLLIVLAQAAALVPGLAGVGGLRLLRAGRMFRLLAVIGRVVAIGGLAAREGRTVIRREAATFALSVAGLTWIASAVGFTLAEDVGPRGRLHSFFDGLWWSAATITTVGYGDVAPVTVVGRAIGVMTMVVGISTFAVVTAKIAEFLVRTRDDDA